MERSFISRHWKQRQQENLFPKQQKQQKQENCQKDKNPGKYPPLNAQMLSFKYDHRNDTPLPLTLRYSFYIPQDCF